MEVHKFLTNLFGGQSLVKDNTHFQILKKDKKSLVWIFTETACGRGKWGVSSHTSENIWQQGLKLFQPIKFIEAKSFGEKQ